MSDQPCAKCGKPHQHSSGGPSCSAHRRNGDPCGTRPMQGATVCRMHGGKAPQTQALAARRVALAEAETAIAHERELGRSLPIDPADAMLAMVHEAAGNVEVYRSLVQQLDVDGYGPNAIVGPTGSISKYNEAARHVRVELYDAERERLVRWAKACRDAGVDERRVAVAEEQGRQLAQILQATVARVLDTMSRHSSDTAAIDAVAHEVPTLMRAAIAEVTDQE